MSYFIGFVSRAMAFAIWVASSRTFASAWWRWWSTTADVVQCCTFLDVRQLNIALSSFGTLAVNR